MSSFRMRSAFRLSPLLLALATSFASPASGVARGNGRIAGEAFASRDADSTRTARPGYQGTAIAFATAPNPVILKPGQMAPATGFGAYRGEQALGFKVSRLAENGARAMRLRGRVRSGGQSAFEAVNPTTECTP